MKKLLFLLFMIPMFVLGQTINWEQIDPIPATVRITTPADTDFILIQKVGGFKQRVSYEDFKAGLNPWDHIEYVPQDTFAFKEYTRYYNAEKHTTTLLTENPLVALDDGEELRTPLVINNNGTIIPDGYPVYSTGQMGDLMTVEKADDRTYEESRVVGLATLPIAVGDTGRIVNFGDASLDLTGSGLSLGEAYLDYSKPLGLSNTKPTNGKWICYIGRVLATGINGRIFVMPYQTERTAEQNDETGWPELVTSTLSFNETTREFSLSPTVTSYYWYENGEKYTSTGQSDIIPDEDGQYLFYQDNGTMTYIKNPSLFQAEPLVRSNALIAWVNWDADDKELIFFEDERHKRANYYSRLLHVLIHFSPDLGTQYLFGLEIQDLVVDGTGNSDTHAQFGVEAGGITDEDLFKIIGQQSVAATIPVYYRAGADGDWRRDVQTNFAQLNAIGGRMQYNQWTGTVWQLTEMTNGYYAPIYIYATGGITNKLTAVVSQNQYSALADMNIAALKDDALQDMGQNPFTEARLIGIIGAHTRSNFTNAVQTRFISLEDLLGETSEYIDYRVTGSSGGGGGGTGTTVTAADVSYSNTISGLFSTNVQDALDEIVIDSFPLFIDRTTDDTDDITEGTTNLYDKTVVLNSGGITQVVGTYPNFTLISTEVDGSVTNELQSLSIIDNQLSISDGNTVTLPDEKGASFIDTLILTAHGYAIGDIITCEAKAIADTPDNANVIGIVKEVIDVNTFTYQFSGVYNEGSWLLGMNYFLSTTIAGNAADTTQTYDNGEVYLFLGTGVENGLLLEIDVGYVIEEDTVVPVEVDSIYGKYPIYANYTTDSIIISLDSSFNSADSIYGGYGINIEYVTDSIVINAEITSTPTLQEVLESGNIATEDATVNNLTVSGTGNFGGNVGINNDVPNYELSVADNSNSAVVEIESPVGYDQVLRFSQNGTATGYIGYDATYGTLKIVCGNSFSTVDQMVLNLDQTVEFASNVRGADPILDADFTTKGYMLNDLTTGYLGYWSNDGFTKSALYTTDARNVGLGATTLAAISASVSTLTLGGTNATVSGGIAFQANGILKGYTYFNTDYMIHQGVAGVGHKFLANGILAATINSDGTTDFESTVSVAEPTLDSHAATKKYVDDNAGGSTFSGASVNNPGTGLAPFFWGTEEYDTDNYWTSGSSSRFTVSSAGYYRVTFHGSIDFSANSVWFVGSIYKNGTAVASVKHSQDENWDVSDEESFFMSKVIYLNANDYVQGYVSSMNGSGNPEEVDCTPYFQIEKL